MRVETLLFLDDVRSIPDIVASMPIHIGTYIARSSKEAIDYMMSMGWPNYMLLDYDLGGDDTAVSNKIGIIALSPKNG